MKFAYTLRKRSCASGPIVCRALGEAFETDVSAPDSYESADGGRDHALLEVIDHFAETERHIAQHVAGLQHALYRHEVPRIKSRPFREGD
jgi:hypothetical protein